LGQPSKSRNNKVNKEIKDNMIAYADKFPAMVFGPANVLLVIPKESLSGKGLARWIIPVSSPSPKNRA